jgi:cell division protein FtsQ
MPNFSRLLAANTANTSAMERWVFAIGLGCCLLGLIGLLRWGPSDPVEEIRVDATYTGLSASDLWPYLEEVFGEDLLAVDLSALADRLQQHPWIDSVKLRRVWPHTLVVDVTEPEPFAHWQGLRGEVGFVTETGVALEADGTPSLSLVYQGGADHVEEFLRWQAEVVAALEGKAWQLQQLSRSDYGQWRVTVTDAQQQPLQLRFGARWDEALWSRFEKAWDAGLVEHKANIAYVDLRYGGGLAVGWHRQVSQAEDSNFDLSMWAKAPQGV